MNPQRFLAPLLCIILYGSTFVQAQDMDAELSSLADKLALPIKDHGNKKITVIDFTDLEGGVSELGKYIAEQLTVDLVMSKRDFAMLDRANLRKILAEHKLTAQGLVDPENAKQLGKFAGVDAIIMGTITPKGQSINLTAKIITTETAEIVGAAKAQFKSDETVEKLSSRAANESGSLNSSPPRTAPLGSQELKGLTFSVDSLMRQEDGDILIGFTIQNTSSKNAIAIAFQHASNYMKPWPLRSSLHAGDGTQYGIGERTVSGIVAERLTEIAPGKSAKGSMTFDHEGYSRLARNVTAFTFQSELLVNPAYSPSQYENYQPDRDSIPPHCEIQNVFIEFKTP